MVSTGRISIIVFILTVLGIACSIVVCFSVDYFSFVSLRNETFTDPTGQKQQPPPFEHATEANVGIFRYEILDVFVYPWPPKEQERRLFDDLHNRELRRLMAVERMAEEDENDLDQNWNYILRNLQNDTEVPVEQDDSLGNLTSGENATDFDKSSTLANETDPVLGGNETDPSLGSNETETPEVTKPPAVNLTAAPTVLPPALPPSELPNVLPGNTAGGEVPTGTPSAAPTIVNPNDLIQEEIGVVKPYPEGIGQFDQMFTNAQRGAMLAPIFAAIGFFFAGIEFCCCTYKCSWLPGAICLYAAFMFQLMTMFLFMSENFWYVVDLS
jgi:hypothetical protein